jgi:hypothetical protein
MFDMFEDWKFWIAVLGATLVKMMTSQWQSFTRAVMMIVTAVFCAWAFTDPFLDWWRLDPITYRPAVAALFAVTGEGLIRWLITVTPDKLFDMWRGRK